MLLHFDGPTASNARAAVNKDIAAVRYGAFAVLKAHLVNRHKLPHWDKKLMFVDDIQPVQGPDGVIPSLAGLYYFEYRMMNTLGNLLLFEILIQGGFKFFPRVFDWKLSLVIDLPFRSDNALTIGDVKRASEIMESVTDNYCNFGGRKLPLTLYTEALHSVRLLINTKGVEVRANEVGNNIVNVTDVLVGPFNLEP